MEISNVSSSLSMQQDLSKSTTEATGEDFKSALTQAIQNNDDDELKASCDEMEAYMISMMFKQMKECMLSDDDEDALIPKGDYTSTFESKMIDTMAENMVEAGGLGLSDLMYKQIKNTYGAQMQMSTEQKQALASTAMPLDEEV